MILAKELEFAYEALEPVISQKTLFFHHSKHYKGYVNKTNELIAGTDMADLGLQEIIFRASSDMVYETLFNNVAQVFNHEFYFNSLTPQGDETKISPVLMAQIEKDFSSLEALKQQLIQKGASVFGSGYVWLVEKQGSLSVVTTQNANTPLTEGFVTPLLAIDVWEHGYYLDYQNLRLDYLTKVVNGCLNWAFVAQNYQKVKGE